ncbi:hypothetical protein LZ32DRAFT_301084 [Colletotrichum eremochloae]|nr:hypothetical protein LZ32DRAFT_301084 [Colletotrichum eremochloae]
MYKGTLLPPPRRAPKQHHVTLLHTSPPKPFRVKDGGVGGHFPPFPSSLGHPRPPPSRRPCPPCPSANHPSAREPSCVCSVSGDFTTCATVEEWFNHWEAGIFRYCLWPRNRAWTSERRVQVREGDSTGRTAGQPDLPYRPNRAA